MPGNSAIGTSRKRRAYDCVVIGVEVDVNNDNSAGQNVDHIDMPLTPQRVWAAMNG